MIVAGLTGSIAMGKSTVAAMFGAFGAPVFDADSAVRDLYASPHAQAVEAEFPGVVVDGRVDRGRLSERVVNDRDAFARLEAIVHPAVARRRAVFLEHAANRGRRLVLLDVPLLFETGAERGVDFVLVVSAPAHVQRARALGREGMSEAKFAAILARQTPDAEKRRRAHVVVDTGGSLQTTRAQVAGVMRAAAAMPGGGLRDA